jgi:hypothetical protein
MEFKTVEQEITPILKESEAARCDDMALYANYAYSKIAKLNYGAGWLQKIFSDRRFRIIHGIAPYETVSRVRRKLQEKYAELRPSEAYREERKRVEAEYKKYAKEKGGGVNE